MQLPTQFGPYLLLERVSVGGMAEVYKAKEYGVDGFERTVAIKRILPHVAEDDEFIAMFKDEAKIAVQLNHGNIAQIYNLGNVQDSFYIALEYVNGRDLRAIFQKCQQQGKPMPVSQAVYVIMKICEGLDYAHNKKDKNQQELHIVHRDVSPPNILVSFEGEVKLIDFGVAKAAGRASRTQAGILKGKFGYMSPEQVRGMPLDRRSDVFSVGVVLFEMLCGQRLFQAETDFATLEKVRAVDVPRPSSLNPEIQKPLENIMYKALAREPEQRYQSSIELHDELQAFMFAQGLFYSRKDLAAWMRQQYAREIELEKEKDRAQAAIRPDTLPAREQPRRQRKTMMMSGGGPPPPPSGTASRKAAPPPPPRPGGPGRTAASLPAPKNKRKTMVMSPSRPNLPTPAGQGRGTGVGDGPTRPVGEVSPPQPLANAAKARSDAAGAGATVDPFGELDWDDEELETRLFEGDNEAPRPAEDRVTAAVSLSAERNAQIGGAIATAPGSASSPLAPPRAASVTVAPGATMVPPSGVNRTVVPPGGTPLGVPPVSLPPYPGVYPGATSVAPPLGPPLPGLPPGATGRTQALPIVARQIVDFGERRQSSLSGAAVAILLGVIVLFGVSVIGTVIVLRARARLPRVEVQGPIDDAPAPASIVPVDPKGALTLETIPAAAIVTVDGNPVNGASPFVVSELHYGPHRLSISGPGYLPIERDVAISASPISLRFTLQRRDVALALESDPEAAKFQLLVNGKVTSTGTSGRTFTISRDPTASYQLDVSSKGYLSQRFPIEFTGEAQQSIKVALVREAEGVTAAAVEGPAASVVVTPPVGPGPAAAPSGASSGSSTKPSTPTKPASSGSGSSSKSSNGGGSKPSASSRKPSTSAGDKPSSTRPGPTPKTSAKTATLRIGTTAGVVPATVYVDGEMIGQTPLPNVMVTPGRHTVRYKWPDGREIKKTVSVNDGAVQIVKAG